MSRSFEERKSGTLLIAVVLAGVTALSVLGEYTYFGNTTESIALSSAWIAVLACGIAGGLLGGLFSSSLIFGTRQIAAYLSAYPIRIAFFCGLILSLVGFLSAGQTFGTGYLEAKNLVGGGEVTTAFPFYKMLATIASYLSGIPGGIFAPSLSIGAGLGADIAQFMPGIPFSAIVMLGMVGYFTGVVQTPITAFVIVMEMTDSSSMLMPLMTTALIAKAISHLVCPTPIYQAFFSSFDLSRLELTLPGLEAEQLPLAQRPARYDLALYEVSLGGTQELVLTKALETANQQVSLRPGLSFGFERCARLAVFFALNPVKIPDALEINQHSRLNGASFHPHQKIGSPGLGIGIAFMLG